MTVSVIYEEEISKSIKIFSSFFSQTMEAKKLDKKMLLKIALFCMQSSNLAFSTIFSNHLEVNADRTNYKMAVVLQQNNFDN